MSQLNSVSFDGFDLNYSTEGQGRATLLVVGSSIYYPRTFSDQLKQAFRLVCTDLPHFVETKSGFLPGSISFDLYANCIEAIRAATGIERMVIVGHSHHGNIALEYAKRFPQNVSHVVLIGTPPGNIAQTVEIAERYWQSQASASRKAALNERRSSIDEVCLEKLTPKDAYVAKYVADAPLYWHNPEYDAFWLWEGMRFGMDAVHAFRDLYQEYEMNWDPGLMKAPVLVVMGRDDFAVPHTTWQNILPNLRNVTFHVLDHSAHTPQLEQPEAFDKILVAWLNQKGANDSYTS